MTYNITYNDNTVTVNGNTVSFNGHGWKWVLIADIVLWLCRNGYKWNLKEI